MSKQHHYALTTRWTGNQATGTSNYLAYSRNYIISVVGKADIEGSSDPQFLGDKTKHNPEVMLVAALSSCHMLWYLHLCAEAGVVVTDYVDHASGIMVELPNGSGSFTEVLLQPEVTVTDCTMIEMANALHEKANQMCFIAKSVNFPVKHQPVFRVQTTSL